MSYKARIFTRSEALDAIDDPESVLQETAWNLFREMRKIVHQYAPRFA